MRSKANATRSIPCTLSSLRKRRLPEMKLRPLVLRKFVTTRWATGMHSTMRWQSWNPISRESSSSHKLKRRRSMLLLIVILLLLFGGGGGYYGYSKWGTGGGLGIVGTVIVIAAILYLLGVLH